jgi:2-polyprenyl-3-methyl-5-hydroxy-6-metoxy-1,4-benzoquinol methylase
MQAQLTNKDLLRFLKNKHIHSGFLNRLKLHYRPLICPYISLINMVRPGDRVGDIGCGSGQFLLLLSAFVQPSFLLGIEINPALIQNAKELMNGQLTAHMELDLYDGINFPSRVSEMDIIFLIDVLHHVPRSAQESFLVQLTAKMKPASTLIIKDIDASNPLVIFNKLHDLVISSEIGHELSPKRTAKLLTGAGMHIDAIHKTTTYVYPHYTVVAKKP